MIEITSSQQPIEAKKIARRNLLANITTTRWLLPLILVFQVLLAWVLLRNTVFQDEALYVYAGRQIWQAWLGGPKVTDPYSYYFSGYPYIFPIIGGALDMLGGLELVRAFSTLCMLVVTSCGYYVTNKLFNQRCAIFAALFFVCQGPVLFLSRLATYDPLCLCLLAIGTALAVKAGLGRRPWVALGIGPCLVLAFGAKYAALLFIPLILAALALCALLKWGWVSMLLRGMLGLLSFAVAGTVAALIVLHYDPQMLHAINATTTNRTILVTYSRLELVGHILQTMGLSFAVGFAALIFARKKHLLVVLLFLSLSILVPIYHIYKAELISLDKHLGFSMFFVMPAAGYTLVSLSGFRKRVLSGRYWLAGVALCLLLFQIGTQEAQNMYSVWPSTTQLSYVLKTQVRPASGRYLMEQYEESRYNLEGLTANWQWSGLDFFEYTDKQGRYYAGNDAYVKAIDDGYFDLIQLNYGRNISTGILIAQTLEHSKKYVLLAKVPYHSFYGVGYFWIWRRV